MESGRMLAILGVLALLVAACGPAATPTPRPTLTPTSAPVPPKAKVGGTITIPSEADVKSWDPTREQSLPMYESKNLVWAKLFTAWSDPPKNCTGEIYPLQVQSWRWVDDTTVEFTLKPGIKYHNKPPVSGREAVAQDMVNAFERYRGYRIMEGQSRAVESVTVKDRYTFQMKLRSPRGGLILELFTHFLGPWLEPAEAGGPGGTWWTSPEKSWIGTGAFMFKEWQPGVQFSFERNPDYWLKGRPYLEAVKFVIMPDVATQLAAFRSGQINLKRGWSELAITEAQRNIPGVQVARCPGSTIIGAGMLWLNTSGPPFDDVRVRRAVTMAVDQEAIVKTLYEGRAAYFPVLPGPTQLSLGGKENYPAEIRRFLEYNPTLAKQMLGEAGYPEGFHTTIHFTRGQPDPAVKVAEALVAMLAKIGVKAELNLMETGRYSETVIQAKYPVGDMAISPRGASSPEATFALTTYWSKAGGVNRSIVRDPEYDRLYEEFQAVSDVAKRANLARQLQILVASKAYAVTLPIPDDTVTALHGLHYTWPGNTRDLSMMLQNAWWE